MCPIKGLTENRRLIRLGKIHLGIKVKNEKGVEHPKATDYFVCPPEVQEVYGEQPNRLDIIIPVEDDEMWCSQYYRQYSRTRGLVCKGDGETCRRMLDRRTGAIANRDTKEVVLKEGLPCSGEACPDYQAKKCQEVMNLQFLLPRVPGLGVWQIDTGSINSICNINDTARLLRAVPTLRRVSWLPLTLSLGPKGVTNPDDGKKKIVYCLSMKYDKGLYEILQAGDKPHSALLIPPPAEDQEPLDEIEAIEGEVVQPSQTISGKEEAATETLHTQDTDTDDEPSLEEELFGKSEDDGPAPATPKTKPRSEWDMISKTDVPNYPTLESKFWDLCKRQPPEMYKELGGRNRTDMTVTAWESFLVLKELFAPPPTPSAENPV